MLFDICTFIRDSINNTVTDTIGLMGEVILEISKNSIDRGESKLSLMNTYYTEVLY